MALNLLIEILQLVNQIWGTTGAGERIYFYFDTDCMIIYPEDKGGFDRVYARIHIRNQGVGTDGGGIATANGMPGNFLTNYTIKSQKEKNAILISP
jgi:hypothetical protein